MIRTEQMANTTMFHTAELRIANARTNTKIGSNFAKPIPRKVAEQRKSFMQRLMNS